MDVTTVRDLECFGSFAALAKVCGVTREAVRKWRQIPAEHCIAIEKATGGQVTRYGLRPDVFGSEPREAA